MEEGKEQPAESLSDELTQRMKALVGSVESLHQRLRDEVRQELEQEFQDRLDEELAQLGYLVRQSGEVALAGGPSGVLETPWTRNSSVGQLAELVMGHRWMPLVAKVKENGQIDEASIREAAVQLFLGSPVNLVDMMDGDNEDLTLKVMEASESKWELDPHVESIVNTIRNYTGGNRTHLNCTVPEIDRALDICWKNNDMPTRIEWAIPRRWIYGEHYFSYFFSARGDVQIRDAIKPYHITRLETDPEDMEKVLAFGRPKGTATGRPDASDIEWAAEMDYFEQLKGPFPTQSKASGLREDRLIQRIKFGDSSRKRGRPRLYPVLRFLTYYEHFVVDRIVLNHERSKVVWVRRIKGNRGIEGGRGQLGPRSGEVLTETDRIEWKAMNAEIHADDVKEDARLIRLSIAAGVGIPEHILFQDASNEVYASIRQQDTPFAQMIQSEQQDWVWAIKKMARTLLREKVKRGALKRNTKVELFTVEAYDRLVSEVAPLIEEEAPSLLIEQTIRELSPELPREEVKMPTHEVLVDVHFPPVVQQDPLKLAQESEILDRIQVASKHRLSARHGLRFLEEVRLRQAEQKMLPQALPPGDGNTGTGRKATQGKSTSNRAVSPNEPPKEK